MLDKRSVGDHDLYTQLIEHLQQQCCMRASLPMKHRSSRLQEVILIGRAVVRCDRMNVLCWLVSPWYCERWTPMVISYCYTSLLASKVSMYIFEPALRFYARLTQGYHFPHISAPRLFALLIVAAIMRLSVRRVHYALVPRRLLIVDRVLEVRRVHPCRLLLRRRGVVCIA